MPMQLDGITLTADDHGTVALLHSGPDPGMAAVGRWTVQDVPAIGAKRKEQL
jgi:hypothetical protein